MRTLNKDEHNYIKQIANIHETYCRKQNPTINVLN